MVVHGVRGHEALEPKWPHETRNVEDLGVLGNSDVNSFCPKLRSTPLILEFEQSWHVLVHPICLLGDLLVDKQHKTLMQLQRPPFSYPKATIPPLSPSFIYRRLEVQLADLRRGSSPSEPLHLWCLQVGFGSRVHK